MRPGFVPWAVGLVVVALTASPPAYTAATPKFPDGDRFWNPSIQQFQQWISDGIDTARAETDLASAPGVRRWIWTNAAGKPVGENLKLRTVIVLTPQFVATVVGCAAAWDKEVWQRIEADQATVAEELARKIKGQWDTGAIYLVSLMAPGAEARSRPRFNPQHALSWQGAWSQLGQPNEFALGGSPPAPPDRWWDASYVASWGYLAWNSPQGLGLTNAGQLLGTKCRWTPVASPGATVRPGLAKSIGTPPRLPSGAFRFYAGQPGEYTSVDFTLK